MADINDKMREEFEAWLLGVWPKAMTIKFEGGTGRRVETVAKPLPQGGLFK